MGKMREKPAVAKRANEGPFSTWSHAALHKRGIVGLEWAMGISLLWTSKRSHRGIIIMRAFPQIN